jgi:hypothetical protein
VSRVPALLGLGLGLVFGTATPLRAQISPGPLAAPHVSLEGALRCGSCHGPRGKAEMTALCRACHKEIAWLQDQRDGFHGRHVTEPCGSCHPDHAGREFALISWAGGSPDHFDHAAAGWPLADSHATLRCNECHRPAFRTGAAAGLAPHPAEAPGWVGLRGTCTACHVDSHRGTLNTDCARCHDASHWTTAPRFDHAHSSYPLTGQHATVRCAACHRLGPAAPHDTLASIPVFKPVAHGDCESCHADPHRGRFTGPCRECHVTTGFAVIDRGTFNHNRTRFPLNGRHASVACAACHDRPGQQGKNPPFATCAACHTDPHGGTATLAGAVVDCDGCHDESGFRTSTFTVARHQTTRFRLDGKHAQLACVACHVKNPPGTPAALLGTAGILLRPAFAHCSSCHTDDHGGQLAARPDRGECSSCHTPAGWTPSTFTVAAHATLRLALEGRHAEIPCAACHAAAPAGLPPAPGPLGKAAVALRPRGSDCTACHVDPHQGRFAAAGARPVGCRGCHTMQSFRPSTIGIDEHARYAFALEGAHRAVPCQGCHAELRRTETRSSLVRLTWTGAPLSFAVTGRSCDACHRNPHSDQFAAEPRGGSCERCHGMDVFRPASKFDHDRDTQFPLRGGHVNVPCARCHPLVAGPGGTRIVRYRPVIARCENCHGSGVRP